MRARTWIVVCVLTIVGLGTTANAWNPVSAFVDKLEEAERGLGSIIGAPGGGLVEALAQPSIRDAEDSLHRLVGDIDTRLGSDLDHLGGIGSNLVGQVNNAAADRVTQIDKSLQARIVQVQTSVDDSAKRIFDQANSLVGRIDKAARERIQQISDVAQKLLFTFDADLNRDLANFDDMLVHRLADVHALVEDALQHANQIAKDRLDQLDEIAAKRIENIDVIATKQTNSIEGQLLRIAALIGMVGFLAVALWWLFKEIGTGWGLQPADLGVFTRVSNTFMHSIPRAAYQVAFAGASAWLLWILSMRLPMQSDRQKKQQLANHTASFDNAISVLDLSNGRVEEAQLELLDDPALTAHRASLAKAELIHAVFTQPGTLQTAAGVKELVQLVNTVELQLKNDPDVMIVKGYILWQVGGDHASEVEAAVLCAQALQMHATDMRLGALARNYIDIVLAEPDVIVRPEDQQALRAAHDLPAPADKDGWFAPTIAYDTAVRTLEDHAMPAYIEMLKQEAAVQVEAAKHTPDTAALEKDRAARTKAAQDVVDAWYAFDQALQSPDLAGETVALSAFTLDDAVLSHALYYVSEPNTTGLMPELATVDMRKGAQPTTYSTPAKTDPALSGVQRVKTAPVRVEWARRYAPMVGTNGQQVLAFEESQRFKEFEKRVRMFEQAYVGFLMEPTGGKDTSRLGEKAAELASEMGLAVDNGRTRISKQIQDALGGLSAGVAKAVQANEQRRAIRLL